MNRQAAIARFPVPDRQCDLDACHDEFFLTGRVPHT